MRARARIRAGSRPRSQAPPRPPAGHRAAVAVNKLQRRRPIARRVRIAGRTAAAATRPARRSTLSPRALLELMRLSSPSLPVGGFSYSEGLEAAVEARLVTSEATASAWLCDQLHLGLARCDLAVVAKALAAWRRGDDERVAELNRWFASTREASEQRQQAEQTGRSLAQWLRLRGAS